MGEESVVLGNVSDFWVEHNLAMSVPLVEGLENGFDVVLVESVRNSLEQNPCNFIKLLSNLF